MPTFSFNPANGALSALATFNFFAQSVHLALVPTAAGFHLFSSSYGNGSLGFYRSDSGITSVTAVGSVNPGPMTHSSSYDSRRNLLYTASLGANKILVYRVDPAALTLLGEIAITSPRTVIYDFVYDKLYVATEASSIASYIKALAIALNGNSVSSTEVGSLQMPLAGGDLKILHRHNFILATARAAGQESIWGMPVTATGIQDATRAPFSLSVQQPSPRALEITEDGSYLAIGSGGGTTTRSIIVYKLLFDSNSRYLSATQTFTLQQPSSLLCGLQIPVY